MKKEIVLSSILVIGISFFFWMDEKIVGILMGIGLLWLFFLHLRTGKSAVLVFTIVALFSVHLWIELHPQLLPIEENVQGIIVLNPNTIRVNGDFLSGIATFEGKSIFFYKKLDQEEEQHFFQQLTSVLTAQVTGTVETLEHARNQGTFDAKNYYNSKGVYQRITIKKMERLPMKKNILHRLCEWRKKLVHRIEQQEDNFLKTYALLLVFGEKNYADETIIAHYQQLGVMHLLAISGLHVQLMILVCLKMLKRLQVTREMSQGIMIGLLFLYGWLMDWNVSGSRAIWMYIFGTFMEKRGYTVSTLERLGVVFLLSAVIHPMALLGIGFQLSYGLTAVVIVIEQWSKCVFHHQKIRMLFEPLLVVFCALPLICHYFFVWNVWSLVLTPVLTYVFGSVLLPVSFLYVIWIWCGKISIFSSVFGLVNQLFGGLNYFFEWCESFQWTRVTFGQWDWWEWIFYALLLYSWFVVMEQAKFSRKIKLGQFLLIIGCLLMVPYHWTTEIVMMDIGQGDAILIQTPGWNQATLIDTGGIVSFEKKEAWRLKKQKNQATTTLIPTLQARGIAHLQQVMLSHADWDHVGNLEDLRQRIPIRMLTVANGMEEHSIVQDFCKKYPTTALFRVQKEMTYQMHGVQWRILSPQKQSKGENDDSIVAIASICQQSILLTGDASKTVEEEICRQYPQLSFSLLKIGHHGSKTATSETLLHQSPIDAAFISAGVHNRYHHPHEETMERLQKLAIHTYVTKDEGAICVQLSPKKIRIHTTLTKRAETIDKTHDSRYTKDTK